MDIRIPYFENMELGKAYNIAMESVKDWVLFIDHDIMLATNPYYFNACKAAIYELGHKAGWITCVTNRIAAEPQLSKGAPIGNDIIEHMGHAKKLWTEHNGSVLKINEGKRTNDGLDFPGFSGFFMLTHKKAWKDVGGFKDGFLGVDNDYYHKLLKHGYDTYVMQGIYVYHIYREKMRWETL